MALSLFYPDDPACHGNAPGGAGKMMNGQWNEKGRRFLKD